jgi:hypothetical protein
LQPWPSHQFFCAKIEFSDVPLEVFGCGPKIAARGALQRAGIAAEMTKSSTVAALGWVSEA